MKGEGYFFRPHHFLCTLGFRGMGYSPDFIENFKGVIELIKSGTPIHVTFGLDTLCAPCPNHNGTLCHQQDFITKLDRQHAKALDLKEGDILTWEDSLKKMKERISLDIFHQICEGCSWKESGVCESALRDLLST